MDRRKMSAIAILMVILCVLCACSKRNCQGNASAESQQQDVGFKQPVESSCENSENEKAALAEEVDALVRRVELAEKRATNKQLVYQPIIVPVVIPNNTNNDYASKGDISELKEQLVSNVVSLRKKLNRTGKELEAKISSTERDLKYEIASTALRQVEAAKKAAPPAPAPIPYVTVGCIDEASDCVHRCFVNVRQAEVVMNGKKYHHISWDGGSIDWPGRIAQSHPYFENTTPLLGQVYIPKPKRIVIATYVPECFVLFNDDGMWYRDPITGEYHKADDGTVFTTEKVALTTQQ